MLGPVGESCYVDTLGREVDGPELLVCLEVESVLGDRDLDHLGELFLLLACGCDTVAQNDTVDGDGYVRTESEVECGDGVAIVCGQGCLLVVPEEPDSDLGCLPVHLLAESVCPDVLVEDGDVGGGVSELDLDRVPQSGGTADT